MKKLEIKITFEIKEGQSPIKILRESGYFLLCRLMMKTGAKVSHSVVNDNRLNMSKILVSIAKHFKLPNYVIASDEVNRDVIEVRQLCMYFMRHEILPRPTLKDIGDFFDRDHATVLHSCTRIQNLIDTEKQFKEKVENIRNSL